MTSPYIQFIFAVIAILVAGTCLVHFAEKIGDNTKIGKLFIGSILLAGATSLPEFMVDISAIKNNMPDLAVGDLVGSSIFNLLILAIADLLHKQKSGIFSLAASKHALAGVASINVTTVAAIFILLGDKTQKLGFVGVGIGPWFITMTYILCLRMIYFDQLSLNTRNDRPTDSKKRFLLLKAGLGFLASAFVIFLAAPYLASSTGKIADIAGLGKTFIGTTLLAFSTSLPELVSTIVAVKRGSYELALGNIFGSNAFNMLILLPLDYLYQGTLLEDISPTHTFTCIATIVITSVAIMGQLFHKEDRKKFIEPDALTIIFLIVLTNLGVYFLDN